MVPSNEQQVSPGDMLVSSWSQVLAKLRTSIEKEDLASVKRCWGFPGDSVHRESNCQCRRCEFNPWVMKSPWRREWLPTPVFLPEKSPWTEESGGLQFVRSQRIVYDSAAKQQPEVVMLLSPPFYKRKNSEAEVTKLVQGC